jgi:two-component system, cell cycle sensor histidine kinase PleC
MVLQLAAANELAAAPRPLSDATIDRYALPIVPVRSEASGADVYERFTADPDLLAVPVVDNGVPIGLICRSDFDHRLAHAFGNALWAKRPIAAVMDREPMLVERSMPIETIQSMIASDRPSALLRGFIVTDQGRYLGLGTALGLLRATLARSEQRGIELREAYEAATAASRAKSAFLANMSHELRTPLNAIIGFSDVMREDLFGGMPERYRAYANDIYASGRHLLEIVNDLLDMAKIEAGRYELSECEVDVAGVIEATCRVIGPAVARAGLELGIEIDRSVGMVMGDERSLRQIMLNLLSNAVKFTPRAGHVAAFASLERNGEIAIGVRDTGIGMTAQEIAVALTPFGQAAVGYAREQEGTGLGLPLVKGMAELHGGRLAVESKPGVGTTARVVLPANRRVRESLASLSA